jgi:hypothetical protein
MPYNEQAIKRTPMQDEFLTRCVVDPSTRTIYLYSSEGSEKEVVCETVNEFMNALQFVRSICDEEVLSYATPL